MAIFLTTAQIEAITKKASLTSEITWAGGEAITKRSVRMFTTSVAIEVLVRNARAPAVMRLID